MATGPITQIKDIIVPKVFTSYTQIETTEKSALIRAGVIENSSYISNMMASGGTSYNMPFFNDLDNDAARVSTDSIPKDYTGGVKDPDPYKITTGMQTAVVTNRNASWASADLVKYLSGANPMVPIANRVSAYWTRQLQRLFISVVKGVFADNDANPTSAEHVKGDLTNDVKGNAFRDGTTNFTTKNFLKTMYLLGDAAESIDVIMMHSRVMMSLAELNLIETIRDANSNLVYKTFMSKRLIMDDALPAAGGIYETWFFGSGAFQLGVGSVTNATEVERFAGAGNGAGADTLYSRVRWCLHPDGHSFAGAIPDTGGPTNVTYAAAASWERVYPERKQIKIARLITREE